MLGRSGDALPQFSLHRDKKEGDEDTRTTFPRWGMLAGEVQESARELFVRIEVPGLDKEDCEATIDGNRLQLSGAKQIERETGNSTYHLMERTYGTFQRTIILPCNVDTDRAKASFKNGVLTVRLLKLGPDRFKSIQVM